MGRSIPWQAWRISAGRDDRISVGIVIIAAATLGAVLQVLPIPLGRFGHLPLTPLAPFLVLVAFGRRAASCVAAACFAAAWALEPTPLRPLLALAEMLTVIWLGAGRGRSPVVPDAVFWTLVGTAGVIWGGVSGCEGALASLPDPTPLLLPLAGATTAGLATILAGPLGRLVDDGTRRRPPLMIPLSSVLLATLVLFAAVPGLIIAQRTTVQIGQRLEQEARQIAEVDRRRSVQVLAAVAASVGAAGQPRADELARRLSAIVSPQQGALRLIDPAGGLAALVPSPTDMLTLCDATAPPGLGSTSLWISRSSGPWDWNEQAVACAVEEIDVPSLPAWRLRLVTAPEARRDLELGNLRDLAIGALAATVFALVAAALLARRVSRPLAQLGDTVGRVPSAGVGGLDAPRGGIAEVAELGHSIMMLNRDLLAQRRRASTLEAQLHRIVEHAPIGIYLLHWQPDGTMRLDYCSPSVGSKLGLGHADLDGASRWIDRVHPADREEVARARSALTRERSFVRQYRLRDGNGRYRWVHDELNLLEPEPDGSRNGVGIILDVHDRRETELRLLQMSKLVTLGEMATGMAHELNQPLHVIRMAIENLQSRLGDDGPDRAYVEQKLDRIDDQVRRAARLVDHMRVFGRQPKAEPAPFEVATTIQRVVVLTGEQLRLANIEVEVDAEPDLPAVRGAEELLDQALLNLIVNARDAILERRGAGGGGRIAIAAGLSEGSITITVADNGGGIAPDAADRLFQPFFTTKPPGKGTGLGLSITFGIVRDMGGTISAANREGGATFTLTLPCAA